MDRVQQRFESRSRAQVDEKLPPDVSSSTPAAYGRHHSWSYFWNRHTRMTSWSMPDGWLPCRLNARRWLLRATPVPGGVRVPRRVLTSGASCLYLEPPRYICHGLVNLEPIRCEFMALPTVYEMACFLWLWLPLWKSCNHAALVPAVHVVCVLRLVSVPRQSGGRSSWLPRWRCTVHTVHRTVGSTGPVFGMVLSARCCATTDAVADPARVCLVRQWIHSAFLLGAVWKNFAYFLREGGTQILKSTLRPALHLRTGEVCTVDASIAEQLHLEIWTVFPMSPLHVADFFSCRQTPLLEIFEPSSTHTCECSRARGVAGSPGVSTPR